MEIKKVEIKSKGENEESLFLFRDHYCMTESKENIIALLSICLKPLSIFEKWSGAQKIILVLIGTIDDL
jgi:hypothetical protein